MQQNKMDDIVNIYINKNNNSETSIEQDIKNDEKLNNKTPEKDYCDQDGYCYDNYGYWDLLNNYYVSKIHNIEYFLGT